MNTLLDRLPHEVQREVLSAYKKRKKSKIVGYLAWLFLGWHYLYLRRIGMQFAFWVTLGGMGFWWIIDIFRVGPIINRINEDTLRGLVHEYSQIYRGNEVLNANFSDMNNSQIRSDPSYENEALPAENYADYYQNNTTITKSYLLYLVLPIVIFGIGYGAYQTYAYGTLLGLPSQAYTDELMSENGRHAECSFDNGIRRPCVFNPHRAGGFSGFTVVAYNGVQYEFRKQKSGIMNVQAGGGGSADLGVYYWDKSDRACWNQQDHSICVW